MQFFTLFMKPSSFSNHLCAINLNLSQIYEILFCISCTFFLSIPKQLRHTMHSFSEKNLKEKNNTCKYKQKKNSWINCGFGRMYCKLIIVKFSMQIALRIELCWFSNAYNQVNGYHKVKWQIALFWNIATPAINYKLCK